MSESRLSKKAGLPPGALIHIGTQKTDKMELQVIDFDDKKFEERDLSNVEEAIEFANKSSVSWINVVGLHDVTEIEELGKHFDLDNLVLEDILNTKHRPSFEAFNKHIFFSVKMLGISEDGKSIVSEQVSFIVGSSYVISFQELKGDIFDGLRQRIRTGIGATRKRKVDYLFYRLIDTIVDNYFFIVEYFGDATEELEETVLTAYDEKNLAEIQRIKKLLINFKKSIVPLREALSAMIRDDNNIIKPETGRYLQDVYEHVIQVSESVDTLREMLASIMDLQLSGASNKMNQVMQVLTVVSTVFIPLTFVAGVYGMNFDYMPELHWKLSYPAILLVMFLMLVGMIIFFKRKKWF